MTREEAIELLKQYNLYSPTKQIEEAIFMAIEALAAYPRYKWERDTAISQLEEYGIGFAEKKRDLVEVVRCKDCKHRYVSGNGTTQYYVCDFMDAQFEDEGYCHHGERGKE